MFGSTVRMAYHEVANFMSLITGTQWHHCVCGYSPTYFLDAYRKLLCLIQISLKFIPVVEFRVNLYWGRYQFGPDLVRL